jgi:hypothetical protein
VWHHDIDLHILPHRFYFVVDPEEGEQLAKREGLVDPRDAPRWWPSSRSGSSPSRGPIEGNAKIEFDAKRRDINSKLQMQHCAPLCDEEVWSGRLYTGPMFQKVFGAYPDAHIDECVRMCCMCTRLCLCLACAWTWT